MYVTVQEALEGSPSEDVKKVFKSLRDNIEIVQGTFVHTLCSSFLALTFLLR